MADNGLPDPLSNRFTGEIRRLHGHILSFFLVVRFAIRSNMDLKIPLRDVMPRASMFHPQLPQLRTKTEQTLDMLLPLLIPVVELRTAMRSDAAAM